MKNLATITDRDITGGTLLSTAQPRIAVNAVVFDESKNIALCFFGRANFHTIVGGGVDHGEDLITAIKREVREEAGCNCKIIAEIGSVFENRYEHGFTQERYYYLARVIGEKGELKLTEKEISAQATVRWLPITKALEVIRSHNPRSYQQHFIRKRDIIVLSEVIKNHKDAMEETR